MNLTGADTPTLSVDLELNKIRSLFNSLKPDSYKNCTIDFTQIELPAKISKSSKVALDALIKETIQHSLSSNLHHIIAKVPHSNNAVYKRLVDHQFTPHHIEKGSIVLKYCLKDAGACRYPDYKPLSIGVTIVLFKDSTLSEFLGVKEECNLYKNWKAPTGTVENESEDEILAVLRELKEETGVEVPAKALRLAAVIPTKGRAGNIVDYNFVFTSINEGNPKITAQKSEIKDAKWISVDEFLQRKNLVEHQNRPLVVQEVIKVAKESLEKNSSWKPSTAYFRSPYPTQIYSSKL